MTDRSVNSYKRIVSDVSLSSVTSTVTTLSNANHFISVKLTYRNFVFWRPQVVHFLNGNDLMGFIDGSNPCPPTMISSGEEGAYALGNRASPIRAVWTAVTSALDSSSQSRSLNLIGQLQTLQQGDVSIADYIGRAQVLIEDLTLVGRHVPLVEQNLYIFRGLRPEFRSLVSSLNVRGTPVTLHELSDILGAEEFVTGSSGSGQNGGQSRGIGGGHRGNGGLVAAVGTTNTNLNVNFVGY
ncbi:PREDICTED: uncharacterized protein LOC109151160 [Ipomoea nil]|uniref:uncharacterized protein LOC109151160 n=1 Tax=Ipomoea nil TaxID=35883 RepID=UPI000900D7A8|nr:PREDICTED: uncharacterized protein LOC109151160 [Ipomoea nil]